MERRRFFSLFGLGLLASSFPSVLAACSSEQESTTVSEVQEVETGTKAQEEGDFQEVGTMSDLNATGDLSTEIDGNKVYIFRNPADQSIAAVDPTCNHRGCPVQLAGDNLLCSCHGSSFSLEGDLLKGPATAGLKSYDVRLNGEQILVKLA